MMPLRELDTAFARRGSAEGPGRLGSAGERDPSKAAHLKFPTHSTSALWKGKAFPANGNTETTA